MKGTNDKQKEKSKNALDNEEQPFCPWRASSPIAETLPWCHPFQEVLLWAFQSE